MQKKQVSRRSPSEYKPSQVDIRRFEPRDLDQVQRICYDHFRSTSLAAVRYYIAAHIMDLMFLTLLAFLFMTVKRCAICMILFNLYLFLKSRFEVEQYLNRDCGDLKNIEGFYLSSTDLSNFWVAQVYDAHSKKEIIVGCIGMIPQDHTAAKAVRLIVHGNYRRMRIGSKLLNLLEESAIAAGYSVMYIYTNSLNTRHASFVIQHGYSLINTIPRGLMRGDLLIWKRRIGDRIVSRITSFEKNAATKNNEILD